MEHAHCCSARLSPEHKEFIGVVGQNRPPRCRLERMLHKRSVANGVVDLIQAFTRSNVATRKSNVL